MIVGPQLRQWLRESTKVQVACAAFALGIAVTFSAIGGIPDDPGDLGLQASQPGPDAIDSSAGAATSTVGTAGASASSGAPGSADTGGSTGSERGGAPGTARSAGETGTSPTDPATGSDPSAPLTASDVGVYPDHVDVGFLTVNAGGIEDAGFALGIRSDMREVIKAYVDYANDRGGINGRRINPIIRSTDVLSQTDQMNACTEMARDHRVFGVVDTATLAYAVTQGCVTISNGMPLVHSYALDDDFQAQARGLDIVGPPSLDTLARQWPGEAVHAGVLRPGMTVGVLTDRCEPSNQVVRKILIPGLEASGAKRVVLGETDCNPAAQQADVPNIVTQFNLAGVQLVLPAASSVAVQTFTTYAESQGYRPNYFVSDYNGISADLFAKNFHPDQFEDVRGFTSSYSGWSRAGKPQPPEQVLCGQILTERGLAGVDDFPRNTEALIMCDNFLFFVRAAQAAGPNLTRTAWAHHSPQVGTFKRAYGGPVTYRPGKYSGGDTVHEIVYRRDCRCYESISDLRPPAN